MTTIETTVVSALKEYRDEANRRRQISKVDPVADAIEHIATDLSQRIELARLAEGEWLSVEDYAAQPDVNRTAQTVRAWIRAGQLAAKPTGRGYLIRKGEKRIVRRRTA